MARYQNDLHNLNYNLIFQIKLELDSLISLSRTNFVEKLVTMWNNNQIMNPQKKDLWMSTTVNSKPLSIPYSNIMQIIATIEEYRYYLEHLDRLRLSFFTYHRNDTLLMRILIYNKKWGYEACKIFFMKFSLLTRPLKQG